MDEKVEHFLILFIYQPIYILFSVPQRVLGAPLSHQQLSGSSVRRIQNYLGKFV